MRTQRFNQLAAFLREIRRTPLMTADEELAAAKDVGQARRRWLDKARGRLTAPGRANAAWKGRVVRSPLRAAAAAGPAEPLREDLAEVARLEQEYHRACHRLVLPNLRLVLSVVNRCGPSREELADFVQEGVLGLMRAVEKFDPTRGCRFSTYAYWWIRTAVLQAKLRHGSLGHISQRMTQKLRKVRLAKLFVWQTTCRRPTLRQTARAAGMSESTVEGLQRIRRPVFSLDRPHSEDDPRELAEGIPDRRGEDLSGRLDRDLLKERIRALLQELDARERQVICLRFGLEGGPPLSLRDTGSITRLSGERIRQIEENTMRKLRQPGRVARLVEFLDEPAPALMNAAAELRTCAYDALIEQDRVRETRLRLRKNIAREGTPCQTSERSPDAA